MKKKVAKIFKKYSEDKIKMIKKYVPVTKKGETTAISGARRDINKAIGNILLNAETKEQKLVGEVLTGDYFEDWNPDKNEVIKY